MIFITSENEDVCEIARISEYMSEYESVYASFKYVEMRDRFNYPSSQHTINPRIVTCGYFLQPSVKKQE